MSARNQLRTDSSSGVVPQATSINLGTANVCPSGNTTPAPCSQWATVTFNVSSTMTLGTPKVLLLGAPNLDFIDGGHGTCSGIVNAGTCFVNVKFTPLYPGERRGAVQIVDSSGKVLATTFVYGVGNAPQIAFSPGTPKELKFKGGEAGGIAVDGAGNIYAADYYENRVVMLPANGGPQVTISGGINEASDVAIDGAGNVIVTDRLDGQVVEVPSDGSPNVIIGDQIRLAYDLTVDGAGNVFVSTASTSSIFKLPTAGGAKILLPITGLRLPEGLATNPGGDLFIACYGCGIYKFSSHGILSLLSSFGPEGIDIDAAGDLLLAGSGISELPVTGPEFSFPIGFPDQSANVRLDSLGDFFYSNSPGIVTEVQNTPLPLNFYPTTVGTTSPAQSFSVQNTGNTSLTINSIGISEFYAFVAGSGVIPDCQAASTLSPGARCNMSVVFQPSDGGVLPGSITIKDNTLNGSATQTIALSGEGVGVIVPFATTTTLAANPSSVLNGNPITFTATVPSALGTPSGSVVFSDSTEIFKTVPLNAAGVATYTTSALSPGSDVIEARYTGETKPTGYSPSSATATVQILRPPHIASLISLSPNGGSGSEQTFTATYSDSSGIPDLFNVGLIFNTVASYSNACYAAYYPATNSLYLANNGGSLQGPITPGSSSTLSNSQCTLFGTGSSAGPSGANLTVTYNIAFSDTLTTPQKSYLLAKSVSGSGTGVQVYGTWTPLNYPAHLSATSLSFTPQTVAIASASQTLTVTNGSSDTLGIIDISIAGTDPADFSETNNCGTSLAPSASCTVAISFKPTATGTRSASLVVVDNSTSSPQTASLTGMAVASAQPSVLSLSPNAGSGATQSFTATYSDSSGTADLHNANILFGDSNSIAGACYVTYIPKTNTLYLAANTGALMGPITAGSAATLANNQCTVSAAGSGATAKGNTLTVTFNISFTNSFTGQKNVYLSTKTANGTNTGGLLEGIWTP